MSIIKAKKEDGENITCVQPDDDTQRTVEDLKNRGYIEIYNAETGEQY